MSFREEQTIRCLVCNRPIGESRDGEFVAEHAGRVFIAPRETTCTMGHRWAVVPTGSLPQLIRAGS